MSIGLLSSVHNVISTVCTWFMCIFLLFRLPELLNILKGVELSQELIVSSFIKLFRTLCSGFGKSFTRKKVLYLNYLCIIPFLVSELVEPVRPAASTMQSI